MICIGKRYELVSQLGAGGMGVVYRAHDRLKRSHVALKRVPLHRLAGSTVGIADTTSQSSATPAMRQLRTALAQEFRTLASLRHPNIISVLDYGFDEERTPYFTMELLDDPQDLITACAKLDRDARIELIVQLLRALTYLHRRGITHRDLKPSNVLVMNTPQGRVLKVVDFGIAAQRGMQRELAGTLQYMAPEVLSGQAPTEASDLYAVGVMLFQMLTGYFPHSRARITQQAAVTVDSDDSDEQEPTMASSVVAFILANSTDHDSHEIIEARDERVSFALLGSVMPEPGMTELVTRLLSRDPAERYRDAAHVWSDLSAVTGNPITLDTSETRESFLQASVLVGRERELETLESALSRARGGEGGILLLGGESGSGKSRLLDELRSSALVRGVQVLRGQAVSSGGSAYQVFLDALRALALDGTLDDFEAAVLKELIPELPALLGRALADAPLQSPQAAQQRLHRVLSSVLTRSPGPTLLLLEDLHWASPESLELLRALHAEAPKHALLIVVSYRADERPDLPELFPTAEHLLLHRLTPEEIAALSASMLGDVGTQPELVALLARETEGNPPRMNW